MAGKFKITFEVLVLVLTMDICFSETIKGTYIGSFETLHHDVSGKLYFVDDKTLRFEQFTYDGEGPATVFLAGLKDIHTFKVDGTGIPIKDENDESGPLKMYNKSDFALTLPYGIHSKNLLWVAVWCQFFKLDFGHVYITKDLEFDFRTIKSNKPDH